MKKNGSNSQSSKKISTHPSNHLLDQIQEEGTKMSVSNSDKNQDAYESAESDQEKEDFDIFDEKYEKVINKWQNSNK